MIDDTQIAIKYHLLFKIINCQIYILIIFGNFVTFI